MKRNKASSTATVLLTAAACAAPGMAQAQQIYGSRRVSGEQPGVCDGAAEMKEKGEKDD